MLSRRVGGGERVLLKFLMGVFSPKIEIYFRPKSVIFLYTISDLRGKSIPHFRPRKQVQGSNIKR